MAKISSVKRKNIKGGKLTKGKKTSNKALKKTRKRLALVKKLKQRNATKKGSSTGGPPNDDEAVAADVLDMLDKEELAFIHSKERIRNPALILSNKSSSKKRKRDDEDDDDLEDLYETMFEQKEASELPLRPLLPIKTKHGLEMQFTEEERKPLVQKQKNVKVTVLKKPSLEMEAEKFPVELSKNGRAISKLALAQRRKHKLAEYKVKIGLLSASFLEDPENRMKNLDSLLAMLVTPDSAVSMSVPKLCALSLLAVFQDVLPSYPIKHANKEGVKLKIETRELQSHEDALLRRYKVYLQRMEKMVSKYVPKKKPKQLPNEAEIKFGHVALTCMCKMLNSHPYFNLSINIVNFIIPFLNNWNPTVREIISMAVKTTFRMDKRGQISYEIVRRINILVKSKIGPKKAGLLRRDVIDVLLGLRIKEADLEREKKEEMIPNKKMTFEQRKMLSKRQRKKAKEMVLLEKELLEASAEENRAKKSFYLTEITKIVFTIYFRAIKSDSKAALLSAVLEGLGRFAHIINIDYFDDLLKVLNNLQVKENFPQRQALLCIVTVLAVLDGQGSVLALDPTVFHKSLYGHLITLHCGKPETNVALAMRSVYLTNKKKMPGPRAASFVKRLATVSLQLEYNETLACLIQLKQLIMMHGNTKSLLDSEGSIASGVYLPELNDPDHSMAHTSTLWELTSLSSHYHPWVRKVAKGICSTEKVESLPTEILRRTPEDICMELDPYGSIDFYPPPPSIDLKRTASTKPRPSILKLQTDYFCDLEL